MADSDRYQPLLDESKTGSDKNARNSDAGVADSGRLVAEQARNALSDDATSTPIISAAAQQKYGLQVRNVDGKSEAYYRAGGQDHVVISSDQKLVTTKDQDVEQALQREMRDLESAYKIQFAKPGEFVDKQSSQNSECKIVVGDEIHTVQPKFTDVYAMREALEHSSPSQLTKDGTTGLKAYFLDKNIFAKAVYGDKPALAVYIREDKDKHPALYVTPEGGRLPPSANDATDAGKRNLAYVIEHEFTHNSQNKQWKDYPMVPDLLPETFGWSTLFKGDNHAVYGLNGKNGERYVNVPMGCGQNTAWYGMRDKGVLGEDGQVVSDMDKAKLFSNDEVAANALVRPPTYYFPNPTEMFSEGLTKYRTNPESRQQLYKMSPKLYEAVRKHDDQEINNYYGRGTFGYSLYTRALSGAVVPRASRQGKEVELFERSLKTGVP